MEDFNTALVKVDEEFKQRGVNVTWPLFGAVGDGVTDDTGAVQSAIDYIESEYGDRGGTVWIPEGYTFKIDVVKISSMHIRITGGGVVDGQILVESVERANPSSNNIKDLFTVIKDIKFISSDPDKDAAIKISNTRVVSIAGCYFENYVAGIFGFPKDYGIPYQQTARVRISDCVFYDVDYCVKTVWIPWVAGGDPKWVYHQHGDWQVSNCQAYYYERGVTHLHFEGQDGIIITNNILFHDARSNRSPIKEHNIYIRQSNFAIISSNDLFEAGLESIKILDYRVMKISDNAIAWCGQRIPSSAVYVETTDISNTHHACSLAISDNAIDGTSKNGIELGSNPIKAKISDNSIFRVGVDNFYYGTEPISTNLAGVFVKRNDEGIVNKDTVVVCNNVSDRDIVVQRGRSYNNENINAEQLVSVLSINSPTPSVQGEKTLFRTANTVTTNITSLDGAIKGKIVEILINDNFTYIANSGNFSLTRPVYEGIGSTLKLFYNGYQWVEITGRYTGRYAFQDVTSNGVIDLRLHYVWDLFGMGGNSQPISFANSNQDNKVITLMLRSGSGTSPLNLNFSPDIQLPVDFPRQATYNSTIMATFVYNQHLSKWFNLSYQIVPNN
ncbi:hypothetical protein ACFSVM_20370 [Paenibacillus shunpengii]|uniref:Pectate lyase superfamily protein domain-containing protein n=1 Tax=Paenibacillus shunpengii TaxID=2054424 RepID=A0ABW5SU00_9BACL